MPTGSIKLSLPTLHSRAITAVDQMLEMAKKHAGSITEFSERQLVHSLGQIFIKSGYWVGFEHKYHAPRGEYHKERSDLCISRSARKRFSWIEVKMTGLDDQGH